MEKHKFRIDKLYSPGEISRYLRISCIFRFFECVKIEYVGLN